MNEIYNIIGLIFIKIELEKKKLQPLYHSKLNYNHGKLFKKSTFYC